MFRCETCNQSFSSKRTLDEHFKSAKHRGNKEKISPYVCKKCEKGFSNQSNLLRHQKLKCYAQEKKTAKKNNSKNSPEREPVPFEYVIELKNLHQQEIIRAQQEITRMQQEIDRMAIIYENQIRDLKYLNDSLMHDNEKMKNTIMNNSNNNNNHTNSHNTVNSNNQNIQIINANLLNEKFPNVPSIEDVVEMAINDERYKITEKEKNRLLGCKNNITNFSECLYQILFKRSIWLHYRNGALTDTINFPMITTDVNKRTSFIKTRGTWSFRGDNSSMMDALHNIDQFIRTETREMLPFNGNQKLMICNKILKFNYYPSGEIFIPTSNKDPKLMNRIERDLQKMIKNINLVKHFKNLEKEHPDFKNCPSVAFPPTGPRRLPMNPDVNFRFVFKG